MKIRIEMTIPDDIDPSAVLERAQELAVEFHDTDDDNGLDEDAITDAVSVQPIKDDTSTNDIGTKPEGLLGVLLSVRDRLAIFGDPADIPLVVAVDAAIIEIVQPGSRDQPCRNMQRWVLAIDVHDTWIADGFDLTDDRVHDIMTRHLPYAYGHEVGGMVLNRPPDARVAELRGHKTVEEYRQERDGARLRGLSYARNAAATVGGDGA